MGGGRERMLPVLSMLQSMNRKHRTAGLMVGQPCTKSILGGRHWLTVVWPLRPPVCTAAMHHPHWSGAALIGVDDHGTIKLRGCLI